MGVLTRAWPKFASWGRSREVSAGPGTAVGWVVGECPSVEDFKGRRAWGGGGRQARGGGRLDTGSHNQAHKRSLYGCMKGDHL